MYVFALFNFPLERVQPYPAVHSSFHVYRYNHQTHALAVPWVFLGETFAVCRFHELDGLGIPIGIECSVWKPLPIPVLVEVIGTFPTLLLIPTVAKPKHILPRSPGFAPGAPPALPKPTDGLPAAASHALTVVPASSPA